MSIVNSQLYIKKRPSLKREGFSLSKKSVVRLARKLQMLGNGATARLCACRGVVDDADGALSTA